MGNRNLYGHIYIYTKTGTHYLSGKCVIIHRIFRIKLQHFLLHIIYIMHNIQHNKVGRFTIITTKI